MNLIVFSLCFANMFVRLNLINYFVGFIPCQFVIQHLETLYLGGNYVRVVCKRVWRKLKKCALKKSLVISKSPEWHTYEACRGSWRVTLAVALQDKTSSLARQLARDSDLWLIPIVRLNRQNTLFVRNLTFRIPHTPYYKYPYTHKM